MLSVVLLSDVQLSVMFYCYAEFRALYCYTECCVFIVMLSVIAQSVNKLIDVMPINVYLLLCQMPLYLVSLL